MIEIEGLTKAYGAKTAVRDLDLSIPSGEVFAFLGPNGAGKTTTIKILVGLLRPTQGTVRLCGIDIQQEAQRAREILGYIPDQPYLYDKLTGREFLQFVGGMFEIAPAEVRSRIDELADLFDLHDFLDLLTESYSHGMKQRVVFASALLHRPQILIVDEPIVGLDPRSSRTAVEVFRQEASRGATVFMSTHSLHVAERAADRIGILKEGKLIALGTMSELRRGTETSDDLEEIFLRLTEEEAA